jgi:hypothetical protein
MKTKRKAPAAPDFSAAQADAVFKRAQEQGRDKLDEAHNEMWDGLNFLKLIELAADSAVDDRDNADDYAFAISTAVLATVEKFNRAHDLIDEFNMQMTHRLMREMNAGP